MVRELDRLLQLRNEAWGRFNPRLLPSKKNNGWPDFAMANAKYLNCYKSLNNGKEPPPDEIEIIASNYYQWLRYDRKHWEKTVPTQVWGYTKQES